MGLFDRLFRRRSQSNDPGTLNPSSTIYTHPPATGGGERDERGSSEERGDGGRDEPERGDEGQIDPSAQQIDVGESGSTQDVDVGGGDSGGGDSGGGDSGGGGNGGGGGE